MRVLTSIIAAIAVVQAAEAATAEDVLARMDAASATFQGMSAKLDKESYTAVIKDKSTESGTILLSKGKKRDTQMLMEFSAPDARTVALSGRKAEIFYPKLKTVQEYDLGKFGSLVDQFLLLGFGTSGKELSQAYTVRLAGQETVAGHKAEKLELTPKTKEAQQQLKKVELWIPEGQGYPVQQKFFQPSGDYTLVGYSNVKVNPGTSPAALKLKLPSGTKREFPQK